MRTLLRSSFIAVFVGLLWLVMVSYIVLLLEFPFFGLNSVSKPDIYIEGGGDGEVALDLTNQTRKDDPIDIVYTYAGPSDESDIDNMRTRDNNELFYSLRSVYNNLKWIRYIFIVINNENHIPKRWFNVSCCQTNDWCRKIRWITHKQIFLNESNTHNVTNSDAIETTLHRIPGLAEKFIFLNDDYMIGCPLQPSFFFNPKSGYPRLIRHIYQWYSKNINKSQIVYQSFKYVPLKKDHVPYRFHTYADHLPRAMTKSVQYQLENTYPQYFRFVESHSRQRFTSYSLTRHSGLEEAMPLVWYYWRFMNGTIEPLSHNYSYDPKCGSQHCWLSGRSTFRPQNLKRKLKKYRNCATMCINDVFDKTGGELYHTQNWLIQSFFETQFNQSAPWERTDLQLSYQRKTEWNESFVNYLIDDVYNDSYYKSYRLEAEKASKSKKERNNKPITDNPPL